MIFSEKVKNQDVWTWMSRYCEVINAVEVMDIDGIKTGTRRFQVRLHRKDGALQHLPCSIQLGAFRGSVFYPGQPKECRKCGSLLHLAAACTQNACRICKSKDHATSQCSAPVQCNLCSSASHRFKDCPQAYSNRVKLSAATTEVNKEQMRGYLESQPSMTALQCTNENTQEMETQEKEHGQTWSSETIRGTMGESDAPPLLPSEIITELEPTPSSKPTTANQERTPMSLEDAQIFLDCLMADLPSPSAPQKPPSVSNLLLDAAEDQASVLPLIISPPDVTTSSSQSRKRYQDSSISGDSSPTHNPCTNPNTLPVSPSTSQQLLEPKDALVFSTATMSQDSGQNRDCVKKQKKKKMK